MFVLTTLCGIIVEEIKMKSILLVIVLILTLAACSPVLEVVHQPTQEIVVEQKAEETQPTYPYGSYILVRYSSTGGDTQHISAELFINNNKACSWNISGAQPWDRERDKLYFTPDTCEDMTDPRMGVTWHVANPEKGNNFGEIIFDTKPIQEIPVWTLSGTIFTKLP